MSKMLISKENFVKLIAKIKERSDFIDKLGELNIDIIDVPDLSDDLVKLLDSITNDSEWVGYYCWELNFGKEYKEGTITIYDKPVDISTPEKLYDMLEKDWYKKLLSEGGIIKDAPPTYSPSGTKPKEEINFKCNFNTEVIDWGKFMFDFFDKEKEKENKRRKV